VTPLRRILEAKAISVHELARASGVAPSTLYRLLEGGPRYAPHAATLRKVAKELGVTPNDLREERP